MALQAAFIVPHPPLIVPAVGRGREEEIRTTIDAYDEVARQIAELAPQTIIVTSPHATAYQDYFHISPGTEAHGDMRRFDARDTDLSCAYDTELAGRIAQIAASEGFPAGTDYERDPSLDHATYIPLHFVDKFYHDYRVVRIGLSGLGPIEHYHLGQLIARAVDELGRSAVLVASGDLSHKLAPDGPYGFAPEGPAFDAQVTEAMAQGDFMSILSFDEVFCDRAAECGLRSFQIMAGALDDKGVDARLLSYEGPFGVGYAVASFIVTGDDDRRCFAKRYEEEERERVRAKRAGEDPYVALARASVEHFVRQGTPLPRPKTCPRRCSRSVPGCSCPCTSTVACVAVSAPSAPRPAALPTRSYATASRLAAKTRASIPFVLPSSIKSKSVSTCLVSHRISTRQTNSTLNAMASS